VDTDLSRTAEELRAAAADRAATVRRELLDQAEHARELGGELRHRAEERWEELEPTARRATSKAKIGGWTALRALIGGLAGLPAVLVRGLGGAAHAADELSERGTELGERARELLHDLPTPRRVRRRQRLRLAVWTGAGFGVGLGLGWFLGRRNAAPVSYGQPQPITGVEVPPAVRSAGETVASRASEVAATASAAASDAAGIAGDAAADIADTVADAGATAGEAAREAASDVKETVAAASELTSETVGDAAAEVRDEASGGSGASDETGAEEAGSDEAGSDQPGSDEADDERASGSGA
jgi:hypothetical protein